MQSVFIAIFFTRSVSVLGFGPNVLRFRAFGVGIAAPLLAFAAVSTAAVIPFLSRYNSVIY